MPQKNDSPRLKDSLAKFILAQKNLEKAVALPIKNERDIAGIIQSFVIVYELSWKTLKRFLEFLGHETGSARDVFKTAHKIGVVSEEQVWLDILDARNLASHTYNKAVAEELVEKIKRKYTAAFHGLLQKISDADV